MDIKYNNNMDKISKFKAYGEKFINTGINHQAPQELIEILNERLLYYINSLYFAAPEVVSTKILDSKNKLALIIFNYAGKDNPVWYQKMMNIFNEHN